MSSAKINISALPTADEVKSGDFFVIDDSVVTKKIDFQNIIFGLDNVTFASTISAHSTNIATLSSDLTSLSSQEASDVLYLTGLINTNIQSATASFVNLMFPVNSIKHTIDNVNPGFYLVGTSWTQVAQGLFMAGVGAGVDKNGAGFTVPVEATDSTGEYKHTLITSEVPAHTHNVTQNGGPGGTGTNNSYQNGPQAVGWRLELTQTLTSTSYGGGQSHNNIPPLYGMYVWKRTA